MLEGSAHAALHVFACKQRQTLMTDKMSNHERKVVLQNECNPQHAFSPTGLAHQSSLNMG